MLRSEVIEWAPFRTAEGVTDERLLAASAELQEGFLAGRRGFLGRELLKGADGNWVDLVRWADQEAADEAMRAAEGSPVCHRYFGLMQGPGSEGAGSGVLHFNCRAAYSTAAAPRV